MEEYRNDINYDRFRNGLYDCFNLEEASQEEKDALIEKIETEWWFCGGQDTLSHMHDANNDEGGEVLSAALMRTWLMLWNRTFPNEPMPEPEIECICTKYGLRYNCFITDGSQVLVIGRVCMRQFLPRIAKDMNAKRCERCLEPHKNRKDNFCRGCRIVIKEEQKREAEEQKREAEEREEAEEKRMAEEMRVRELVEAEKRARICQCGSMKLSHFPRCYHCYLRGVREQEDLVEMMTPMQKSIFLCPCGKRKKPTFATCWACK
jgi:hypothetical protein